MNINLEAARQFIKENERTLGCSGLVILMMLSGAGICYASGPHHSGGWDEGIYYEGWGQSQKIGGNNFELSASNSYNTQNGSDGSITGFNSVTVLGTKFALNYGDTFVPDGFAWVTLEVNGKQIWQLRNQALDDFIKKTQEQNDSQPTNP